MHKLIIVDDDSIMRNYLKALINWGKEGFVVVGEAADGKSALSLIQDKMPDIVLTDIDMPVMNGVELIKQLNELKINVKVIVLSCYDDFDYVKQAMKYGASEYLLKHKVEPDEILEVVKSIVTSEIHEEDKSYFDPVEYERKNLQSRVLYNLINDIGYENIQQVLSDFKKYGMDVNINSFIVIKAQIDYFDSIPGMDISGIFNFTILGIIEETFLSKIKGIVVSAGDAKYMIVCSPIEKSEATAQRHIYELLLKTQSAIKKYTNQTTSFGISPIGNDIMSLGGIYTIANKALQYKLYKGTNSIIFNNEAVYNDFMGSSQSIIQTVKASLQESLDSHTQIDELFQKLKEIKPPKDKFDLLMNGLQSIFYVFALEKGLDEIWGDTLKMSILNRFETVGDYQLYFNGLIEKIALLVNKVTHPLRQEIVEAIKFMKNNLDKNISLKEIADHVNLSRVYFSQLFKQLMGENITDFLTRLRLEKAKELLMNPDTKVYEIALDIGFESQYYFNKLFKSTMGVTPTEYRNKKLY